MVMILKHLLTTYLTGFTNIYEKMTPLDKINSSDCGILELSDAVMKKLSSLEIRGLLLFLIPLLSIQLLITSCLRKFSMASF